MASVLLENGVKEYTEIWNNGIVEWWSNGMVERWKDGMVYAGGACGFGAGSLNLIILQSWNLAIM